MHSMTHPGVAWYRQPWPWILMAGPGGVVIAGAVTMWLAFAHEDGLVADDYYKQGLAINRVINRDATARTLGVGAAVRFGAASVRIHLSADAPPALVLTLAHPTRAGQDRIAHLRSLGGGVYEGAMDLPTTGRWHVAVSDAEGRWRLTGDWSPVQGGDLALSAQAGTDGK